MSSWLIMVGKTCSLVSVHIGKNSRSEHHRITDDSGIDSLINMFEMMREFCLEASGVGFQIHNILVNIVKIFGDSL